MSSKRVIRESVYLDEIVVEGREEGGIEHEIAVIDEEDNVEMVFQPSDAMDAQAFADGYAYCKLMLIKDEEEGQKGVLRSLIDRFTP